LFCHAGYAVFVILKPHIQPHAKKWLTPLFGFTHPPPCKGKENRKNKKRILKIIGEQKRATKWQARHLTSVPVAQPHILN